MESITLELSALLDKIPKSVLATFGIIGLLFASSKVLSFVRLLLSLFVLPGKNVCIPRNSTGTGLTINSCGVMVLKAPGL